MTSPRLVLLLAALAATLTACGGGDDASPTGSGTTATTSGGSTVAGCTGKVAAFFTAAQGSYTAKAATFDNVSFTSKPASVAGVADGSSQTVTVHADCTITVGALSLRYKDASYAEFPGTGADAGKTQYDVDLTGTGVADPHFERWTDNRRGLSFFDPAKTSQGVRLDE